MKSKDSAPKFYAVESAGYWFIQSGPNYEDPDILDAEKVGEERAEKNARLIADLLNAHHAQQSQPSGMRWVRASERLPDIDTSDKWNNDNKITKDVVCWSKEWGMRFGRYYYNSGRWSIDGVLSSNQIVIEYWVDLTNPSESSPAGAAEGASEGMKTENFVSVIERRIDYFNKIHHSYEAKELTYALKSIQRLVPPIMFKTGHFEYSINQPASEGMAEALRLLDTASNLVGNPGTNISSSTDLACDSWQEKYKQFLASLSPGVEDNQTKKQ